MEDVWGYGEHIQCMHPAANCIASRTLVSLFACVCLKRASLRCFNAVLLVKVLESWGVVLQGDYDIRLEEVRVHVTQNMAFVTCVEVMNAGNATGR